MAAERAVYNASQDRTELKGTKEVEDERVLSHSLLLNFIGIVSYSVTSNNHTRLLESHSVKPALKSQIWYSGEYFSCKHYTGYITKLRLTDKNLLRSPFWVRVSWGSG